MRIVLAVALAAVAACGGSEQPADSATTTQQPGRPTPVTAPSNAIRQLAWLEGSWRGALPGGGYFHERYQVRDDSTMIMQGFPDSTFATPSDSSLITVRNGTLASEGKESRYVAVRLDSTEVEFAPDRNAANGFVWSRVSPTQWRAVLTVNGAARTTYTLDKVQSR